MRIIFAADLHGDIAQYRELAAVRRLPEASIVVAHTPPYGGNLDTTRAGVHVGSRALAKWIESVQPLLVLCGHIHQAPTVTGHWAEWRGRTLCINPGRGNHLQAVVFDTADMRASMRHTVFGRLT